MFIRPAISYLNSLSKDKLAEMYKEFWGLPADHHPYNVIVAALHLGKRIKRLTEEEIRLVTQA